MSRPWPATDAVVLEAAYAADHRHAHLGGVRSRGQFLAVRRAALRLGPQV